MRTRKIAGREVTAVGLGCIGLSHGNPTTVSGARYDAAGQADVDTEEFAA